MKLELAPVIHLLHSAPVATLATQSQAMPGYPFATVLPLLLDERHQPVLLVSALAEHSKNLLADARVSVSVVEPGVANVQEGQRLTLVGDAQRFEPTPAQLARFLRYQPEASQYLQLDFMFIRIVPARIRYIGGIGRMGWLNAEEFASAQVLTPEDEATMLAELQAEADPQSVLLGVDAYGVDYLRDGVRERAVLPEVGDRGALTELIRQLA